MPVDPELVVAEILGEPAREMRNPVDAEYRCPFLDSRCVKTSQKIAGPYPVCTIRHGGRRAREMGRLMCVCPNRFYQADLVADIVAHCWPGPAPKHPRVAYEIKMANFGNVDMVIADIDPATASVSEFVSVELQAVDISGSYEPAYQGILNSQPLVDVSYGINWKNVRKRFIFQLIEKGFYHHAWKTRIVAVLQTPLYESLRAAMQFEELPPKSGHNTIVFMLYDYVPDPDKTGAYRLQLDKVVGTSHNSLMMASIYQSVPSKSEFCKRILNNLADFER